MATEVLTRRQADADEGNPFGGNGRDISSMTEVAMTRAAQEVQAAMIVAKKFPRNEQASFTRIMQACKRPVLADQAIYEYPRGGQKVEGPSIRLAEVLAQSWGNIESGVIEVERRPGESTAMAYCWDLETNTRDVKIFTVRHIRDKRGGGVELKDERDVYELIANMGARRKRACILAIIPGDVQDAAVNECEKTLSGQNKEPLADRIRAMIAAFAEHSVTQAMIEKRLQHKADEITERELSKLRKVFTSLRDGMSTVEQHFDVGAPAGPSSQTQDLNDELRNHDFARPSSPSPTTKPQQSAPQTNSAAPAKRSEDHSTSPAAEAEQGQVDLSGIGEEPQATAAGSAGTTDDAEIAIREALTGTWDEVKANLRNMTDGVGKKEFEGGVFKFLAARKIAAAADLPATHPALVRELFDAIKGKYWDVRSGAILNPNAD